MAQLVKLGNNIRLRAPVLGLSSYTFSGESVGPSMISVFVDNKQNYTVAIEPGTCGFMRITGVLAQVSTTTGAFLASNYNEIVARYQCTPAGVLTLSLGYPTYGTSSTPEVPVASQPNSRLTTNIVPTAVSSSATNPYPHILMRCSGGASTNNWLLTCDVWTLPIKGV